MGDRSGPRFSTPGEFLEYVRMTFAAARLDAVPDRELLRLTHADMDRLGGLWPDPTDPYGWVIRTLVDEVSVGFRSRCGIDVSESCAIGPLDNPSVNASCLRSDEGHYAIVLYHGLMNLLHKHSKLLTAAVDPSSVVYCNRKDAALLTAEELVAWADELGPIYLETGQTMGAMVKLNETQAAVAGEMTALSESFVLGHEIGHMVAGHLEDNSRFVRDEEFPWLEVFAESPMHEDEFEADSHGFDAMQDHVGATPKPIMLGAVVSTFQALSLIGAGPASPSHPGAIQRIHRLVETRFSAATAQLVRRWVDDGDEEAAIEALTTAH